MAVADDKKTRGTKRSQPGSTVQTKSKKIGRPPHGGLQCSHPRCINKAQTKGKCRTHTGGGKCSHSGCDKQAQFKGLCAGHGGRRICSDPGCEKKVASKGKCGDHGGGRSSSQQGRRKSTRSTDKRHQQDDTSFALLVSTAAVMAPASFPNSDGSMMALLLGGPSQAMVDHGESSSTISGDNNARGSVSVASDIESDVLL